MIWIQNQLEYVSLGKNITLQCNTESFPPAIHFWKRQDGGNIVLGKDFPNFVST